MHPASEPVPAEATPATPRRRHSPDSARALRKEATRARLIQAAVELFHEVGYQRATIRTLAARIGMSTGAVFANFADKDAVYWAAFGHPPLTPEDGLDLRNLLVDLIAAVSGEVDPDLLLAASDHLDRIYPDWRLGLEREGAEQ